MSLYQKLKINGEKKETDETEGTGGTVKGGTTSKTGSNSSAQLNASTAKPNSTTTVAPAVNVTLIVNATCSGTAKVHTVSTNGSAKIDISSCSGTASITNNTGPASLSIVSCNGTLNKVNLTNTATQSIELTCTGPANFSNSTAKEYGNITFTTCKATVNVFNSTGVSNITVTSCNATAKMINSSSITYIPTGSSNITVTNCSGISNITDKNIVIMGCIGTGNITNSTFSGAVNLDVIQCNGTITNAASANSINFTMCTGIGTFSNSTNMETMNITLISCTGSANATSGIYFNEYCDDYYKYHYNYNSQCNFNHTSTSALFTWATYCNTSYAFSIGMAKLQLRTDGSTGLANDIQYLPLNYVCEGPTTCKPTCQPDSCTKSPSAYNADGTITVTTQNMFVFRFVCNLQYAFGYATSTSTQLGASQSCCSIGMKLASFETRAKFDCLINANRAFYGLNENFWTSGVNYGCPERFLWCSVDQLFNSQVPWAASQPASLPIQAT
ncbi:hypothetical protein B566_EDAN007543, partial [Ephemera danica]